MHTFHVYRLWLCLCVVPVLLVGTKTKQQLLGVCFCILCARIRNYTSLKASARWKALILLASSRCLSFPDEMAAAATMTTTTKTTTQNNVHFNTAFNKIPVLRFLLASWYFWFCFSFGQNFIYIVADRREVSCLVHRIEPKRQGITLPLGRISLSFFSAECQLPLVVLEFEPVSPCDVACILWFFLPFVWLWVSFVLVRLCFVGK